MDTEPDPEPDYDLEGLPPAPCKCCAGGVHIDVEHDDFEEEEDDEEEEGDAPAWMKGTTQPVSEALSDAIGHSDEENEVVAYYKMATTVAGFLSSLIAPIGEDTEAQEDIVLEEERKKKGVSTALRQVQDQALAVKPPPPPHSLHEVAIQCIETAKSNRRQDLRRSSVTNIVDATMQTSHTKSVQSEGMKRYIELNKCFFSYGPYSVSEVQEEMFQAGIDAITPVVFGDEWETNQVAIRTALRLDMVRTKVSIKTMRGGGKSDFMARFCASTMWAVPGTEIAVFAKVLDRQAIAIVNKTIMYLRLNPGFSDSMITVNKSGAFSFRRTPDAPDSKITANPASSVDVSMLACVRVCLRPPPSSLRVQETGSFTRPDTTHRRKPLLPHCRTPPSRCPPRAPSVCGPRRSPQKSR